MVMLNRKDLNVLLVYMSVSIPKTVDEDWRAALARDDAKQRKIRLKILLVMINKPKSYLRKNSKSYTIMFGMYFQQKN